MQLFSGVMIPWSCMVPRWSLTCRQKWFEGRTKSAGTARCTECKTPIKQSRSATSIMRLFTCMLLLLRKAKTGGRQKVTESSKPFAPPDPCSTPVLAACVVPRCCWQPPLLLVQGRDGHLAAFMSLLPWKCTPKPCHNLLPMTTTTGYHGNQSKDGYHTFHCAPSKQLSARWSTTDKNHWRSLIFSPFFHLNIGWLRCWLGLVNFG